MKILAEIDVLGKRVFVRADLDVGETLNDERLTTNARLNNLKPTVKYLLEHGARQVVIAGHIDRPEKPDPVLSTRNLIEALEKILGQKIMFSKQLTANSLQQAVSPLRQRSEASGERSAVSKVVLLENLRFWPGEEANDPEFARQLASMADVYVNEAFGVCHRAHASIVGVPAILPHAAGLHLQKEVETLSKLLDAPERPFVAIIGGAKIETKLPVIENLAKVADFVLVGGLIAKHLTRSRSLSGSDNLQLTINRDRSNVKGQMSNVIIADLTADGKDINDQSIEEFKSIIAGAKTVVWNGPMGYFEGGNERGTMEIARAIIDSGAYSVVGGGETTEFLGSKGLLDKFSFVSSGGGAMLEFLSGKSLPGLLALD